MSPNPFLDCFYLDRIVDTERLGQCRSSAVVSDVEARETQVEMFDW
jgi:hypothetical protein